MKTEPSVEDPGTVSIQIYLFRVVEKTAINRTLIIRANFNAHSSACKYY